MNYSKAKYFKDIFPPIRDILLTQFQSVADLNITMNEYIAGQFGIKPRFVRSSEFSLLSKREEKVIDLCAAVGGTRYISGNGARVYQDESHFAARGIELTYLEYKPIEYKQLWKTFLPCMSVIDYIFNCGYDWDYVVNEVKKLNANV